MVVTVVLGTVVVEVVVEDTVVVVVVVLVEVVGNISKGKSPFNAIISVV